MALPQRIEFTRHIFSTHTYTREQPLHERWRRVSKDYNRFFQEYRRLHRCSVSYLRVIESHKDGYPHIHSILQFPDARIRVEDSRYFNKELYQRWRLLWKHGHSDYQKPRNAGIGTISYILKYLIKNTTHKTIWKKTLRSRYVPTVTDGTTVTPSKDLSTTKLPVRIHGVKLATWSRGFDFSVFLARRPESIVKGLKT